MAGEERVLVEDRFVERPTSLRKREDYSGDEGEVGKTTILHRTPVPIQKRIPTGIECRFLP
jgi:hypothetical protein